ARSSATVNGILLHTDARDASIKGLRNPALAAASLPFYADKWEENRFLTRFAPEMAPPTWRADHFLAEHHIRLDGLDDAARLLRFQEALARHVGRFVLKTRNGFAS